MPNLCRVGDVDHSSHLLLAGAGAVVWDCGPTACISGPVDERKEAPRRPLIGFAPVGSWARAWSKRGNAHVEIDDEERALVWDLVQGRLHIVHLDLGCAAHRTRVAVRAPVSAQIQIQRFVHPKNPGDAVAIVDLAPDASSLRVRGCERDQEVRIPELAYAGATSQPKRIYTALSGIDAAFVSRFDSFDFVQTATP